MLSPVEVYKEEIKRQFDLLAYTDKIMWFSGSIDNFDYEIKTEGDKYAFAIVHSGQVIGYISFRVDWYCSMAFNFSLIRFMDIYYDNAEQEYDSTPIMVSAIREVIKMVKSFNLHRIDFRCVSGNPAQRGYDKIAARIIEQGKYNVEVLTFRDNIKDRQGKYHDTICYEFIKEAEND